MIATLNHCSFGQHQDLVCIHNGAQPVGHDDLQTRNMCSKAGDPKVSAVKLASLNTGEQMWQAGGSIHDGAQLVHHDVCNPRNPCNKKHGLIIRVQLRSYPNSRLKARKHGFSHLNS
jgi:hypothetical protein